MKISVKSYLFILNFIFRFLLKSKNISFSLSFHIFVFSWREIAVFYV